MQKMRKLLYMLFFQSERLAVGFAAVAARARFVCRRDPCRAGSCGS